MKRLRQSLKVYAVTNSIFEKGFLDKVEASLAGGVTMLQIREKAADVPTFLKSVAEVVKIAKKYDVAVIVNDNVEVALKSDVAGIHIGQDDGNIVDICHKFKDKVVGVSVSSVVEAKAAEKAGADYLGVGTMFTTNSKADAQLVSFSTLQQICEAVTIPVVAIGGINSKNLHYFHDIDIAGVAIISAIYSSDDVLSSTRNLVSEIELNLGGKS